MIDYPLQWLLLYTINPTSRILKKKKIRKDTVKEIPRCMADSALKHALEWCKYHMERNKYWCHMHNYTLITVGNLDPGRNIEYGHYEYNE